MRLAGHPMHLMLVHFPVALLLTGMGLDVATLAGVDLHAPAFWTMSIGLVMSLPTAVTGMIDWARLRVSDARVGSLVERHLLLVALAVVAFVGAMVFREEGRQGLVVACGVLGSALLGAGAWHGGELVLRHGVGTSPRSDAPDVSSPATTTAPSHEVESVRHP